MTFDWILADYIIGILKNSWFMYHNPHIIWVKYFNPQLQTYTLNNNHHALGPKKNHKPQVISERTRQSHKGDVLPSKFGHIAPGFVGVFGWWDSLALEVVKRDSTATLHNKNTQTKQKRWNRGEDFKSKKKRLQGERYENALYIFLPLPCPAIAVKTP